MVIGFTGSAASAGYSAALVQTYPTANLIDDRLDITFSFDPDDFLGRTL